MGRFHGHLLCAMLYFSCCFGGWVDESTPMKDRTRKAKDGRTFDLVFSDEFGINGRTFHDGHDPRWTSMHKNDYTNNGIHVYDNDYVTTQGGLLNITTDKADTQVLGMNDRTGKKKWETKHFKSAMVNGWNKFCFTGGIVEVRAKLPGDPYVGGFWPAIWILGNLARATYVGSSDNMWPWSFDECDRKIQKKQRISACNPEPHFGLLAKQGRGAPEIDLMEGMSGCVWNPKTKLCDGKMSPASKTSKPYFSSSLQIAPGSDGDDRPIEGLNPWPTGWYKGMEYGKNSSMNIFFYGTKQTKPNKDYSYQTDSISANTEMDKTLWEDFHTWKVEWIPAESDITGEGGSLKWYLDDKFLFGFDGDILNKRGSKVPSEPSYLILNTAISTTWGFPETCPDNCDCSCYDCADKTGKCTCGFAGGFCENLPVHFLIDHVRVYQSLNDTHQKVGCSTPERPTKTWIEGHQDLYMDERVDTQPLQPLRVGGGHCNTDHDCGGSPKRGSCSQRSHHGDRCKCKSGWVGPFCRTQAAFDDVVWESPRDIGFASPVVSSMLIIAITTLVLIGCCAYVVEVRRVGQSTHHDHTTVTLLNFLRSTSSVRLNTEPSESELTSLQPRKIYPDPPMSSERLRGF